MKQNTTIRNIIENLLTIREEEFAYYYLSYDTLYRKFSHKQKFQYIKNAIECGNEEAYELKKTYKSITQILDSFNLKIEKIDALIEYNGNLVFAQYISPDKIKISVDCINKVNNLIKECNLEDYFFNTSLINLLLAHELFHKIEYSKRNTIYTQTERIELWIKPFSNKSKIMQLSEIAAMSFVKNIVDLKFSPYLMDYLFIYCYNKDMCLKLYDDTIRLINKLNIYNNIFKKGNNL